jgi:hypothetical protein
MNVNGLYATSCTFCYQLNLRKNLLCIVMQVDLFVLFQNIILSPLKISKDILNEIHPNLDQFTFDE